MKWIVDGIVSTFFITPKVIDQVKEVGPYGVMMHVIQFLGTGRF